VSATVIRMEYDGGRWFHVPTGDVLEELHGGDLRRWAAGAVSVVLQNEHDVERAEFNRFVDSFLQIAQLRLDDTAEFDAFLHVPDPYVGAQVMYMIPWELEPEHQAEFPELLDLFAMTHDPEAVEPPVREVVNTKGLGSGLRVLRYFLGPGDVLVAAVHYAFRLPLSGNLLELRASGIELGRFLMLMNDMDEFAQGIREEAE